MAKSRKKLSGESADIGGDLRPSCGEERNVSEWTESRHWLSVNFSRGRGGFLRVCVCLARLSDTEKRLLSRAVGRKRMNTMGTVSKQRDLFVLCAR